MRGSPFCLDLVQRHKDIHACAVQRGDTRRFPHASLILIHRSTVTHEEVKQCANEKQRRRRLPAKHELKRCKFQSFTKAFNTFVRAKSYPQCFLVRKLFRVPLIKKTRSAAVITGHFFSPVVLVFAINIRNCGKYQTVMKDPHSTYDLQNICRVTC